MEDPREHYTKRLSALKTERSSWVDHWRDIADYVLPRRGRFLSTDRNKGDKRNTKIIDSTGTMALRTLSSGMMAGLTSPARPWFRLTTPDLDVMEYGPVRDWLETVEDRMRVVFARSNLYNVLPTMYAELGGFGTAGMLLLEDYEDVIRAYPYTAGEYYLAQNERMAIDTVYREVSMTVRQVVKRFGLEQCSGAVRSMWEQGQLDKWVDVVHAVEPREDRDTQSRHAKHMPFRSVWFEKSGDSRVLRESGFLEFPSMCPRWDTTGPDVYGRGPGMDALGDIKQLQVEQLRKAQAIDKMVNPPLTGPANLKGTDVSVLPGGITYHDALTTQAGLRPVYEVNPPLAPLLEDIRDVRERINSVFYADLFLMLSLSDRREMTAREVQERHEEKLLMLGPVIERVQNELLDPLIDRTFSIMTRGNLLPPPPEELAGMELKVEYISILAQAQRMVGTGAVDRLITYVGQAAQLNPGILDKIDWDQTVDEYGEMLGVPNRIIVSDDKVAEIRAQKAAEARQAKMMEQAMAASQVAKNVGEINTDGGTLASDLLGGLS